MDNPSLLSSLTGWFTPTSLFILLNLMIGTIFLTSRLASPRPDHPPNQPLARSSSLLDRVKSINFSHFNFPLLPDHPLDPSPPQLERAPSLIERVRSFKLSRFHTPEPDPDPNPGLGLDHQVRRSKSEPKEDQKVSTEEEKKEKLKSGLVRTVSLGDEAVDAKADDFINRFKQQLKLQRLESLLRHKQRNV